MKKSTLSIERCKTVSTTENFRRQMENRNYILYRLSRYTPFWGTSQTYWRYYRFKLDKAAS